MVKQRVVKETLADGTEWYYPESRFLWLFWRRHYECSEWVHCFTTEKGAWYYFKSQQEKQEKEKAERAAKKTVKREVCNDQL